MLTIKYDPQNGNCRYHDGVIEANVLFHYQQFKNKYLDEITVSQELYINIVRANIAEGKINHEDVQFKFNDIIITVNKFGALNNYPPGFCDIGCLAAERTLRAAVKLRKAEKEKKENVEGFGPRIIYY